MPNYALKFGVSEVARLFDVDRDVVKKWAYKFSDYVSAKANPPKGTPREFCLNDIRVFAYVSTLWEDEPDYENIMWGLNGGYQNDEEFDDLIRQLTPMFTEPPDGLDETWRNVVVFGGLAQYGDRFELAKSFKLAGDKLVDAAVADDDAWSLICPILYTYRHATELYLKDATNSRRFSHGLQGMAQKFRTMIKAEFNETVPGWLEDLIQVFHEYDHYGTTFRYGGDMQVDEVFIDIRHVKKLMTWLAEGFEKLSSHRTGTSYNR